jgi:hypothetical protein
LRIALGSSIARKDRINQNPFIILHRFPFNTSKTSLRLPAVGRNRERE